MEQKNSYLIVGASAAGIAAAKKIRMLDKEGEIHCFTYELELPYNKCFLVDWIEGEKTHEQLLLGTQEFFAQQRITLHLGVRVTGLDPQKKIITTHDGTTYLYTKLLLATGAQAYHLSCPGTENAQGVLPFYTLADTQIIKDAAHNAAVKNIIIIGGGLSGIECADALKNYGKTVTVIERNAHVLARHVTQSGAQYLKRKASEYSVFFKENVSVVGVTTNEQHQVTSVECCDGTSLPADLVITALGSRAHLELAESAGLAVERGALMTNQFLQTSDQAIFAAGDCALVTDLITKHPMRNVMWPDAVLQGIVAGTNMVMCEREYKGVLPVSVSSFFGYNLVSCGRELIDHPEESTGLRTQWKEHDYGCSTIAFDERGVIKAFVLIGLETPYAELKRSLMTDVPLHVSAS